MEIVEGMRGNGYAGASRHGRDPPPFGDAAANRGIRLKNGYAGALDQLSMRPSSRDDFSGRDRQRQSLRQAERSEEHTSELQSLMRISYAVFCLKKKTKKQTVSTYHTTNV